MSVISLGIAIASKVKDTHKKHVVFDQNTEPYKIYMSKAVVVQLALFPQWLGYLGIGWAGTLGWQASWSELVWLCWLAGLAKIAG